MKVLYENNSFKIMNIGDGKVIIEHSISMFDSGCKMIATISLPKEAVQTIVNMEVEDG